MKKIKEERVQWVGDLLCTWPISCSIPSTITGFPGGAKDVSWTQSKESALSTVRYNPPKPEIKINGSRTEIPVKWTHFWKHTTNAFVLPLSHPCVEAHISDAQLFCSKKLTPKSQPKSHTPPSHTSCLPENGKVHATRWQECPHLGVYSLIPV